MNTSQQGIVSAEEARRLGHYAEQRISEPEHYAEDRRERDLAHTVVTQAEQIAAVLALHKWFGVWTDSTTRLMKVCDGCDHPYPCPTARALGVTD